MMARLLANAIRAYSVKVYPQFRDLTIGSAILVLTYPRTKWKKTVLAVPRLSRGMNFVSMVMVMPIIRLISTPVKKFAIIFIRPS